MKMQTTIDGHHFSDNLRTKGRRPRAVVFSFAGAANWTTGLVASAAPWFFPRWAGSVEPHIFGTDMEVSW